MQWLALHDVIETGHQYTGGELAGELDRRFGAGAMDWLALRSTRGRRDPFDIAAEAFRTPATILAAARGCDTSRSDSDDEEDALPLALARAATLARHRAGGEHPRLTSLTAAVMADELIRAGWPSRAPAGRDLRGGATSRIRPSGSTPAAGTGGDDTGPGPVGWDEPRGARTPTAFPPDAEEPETPAAP